MAVERTLAKRFAAAAVGALSAAFAAVGSLALAAPASTLLTIPDAAAQTSPPPAVMAARGSQTQTQPSGALTGLPPLLRPPAPPAPLYFDEEALEPLAPAATALRELLEAEGKPPAARAGAAARASQREVQELAKVYAERDFAPFWFVRGAWTAAARSVATRLERADEDALDLAMPAPALADGEPAAIARTELELSRAVVRYARRASAGRVNPARVSGYIDVKRAIPDAASVLPEVAASAFAGDRLRAFNPPHAGYEALRAQLASLRADAGRDAGPAISGGRTLRVGMRDERVPLVRERLGLSTARAAGGGAVYDAALAGAVADFQRSRGLPAHGRLTPTTARELSGENRQRLIGEVIANMERWRWLPRTLGDTHIMVNVPDFTMRMVRDGKEIHSSRVIVGRPQTQTPIFSDRMSFVVVNPDWHVPQSIIRRDLLPAFEKDPTYFQRKGYEVRTVGDRLVVRQPPGPTNALGYIKFMFPNRHAVYLHDTPSRRLFNSAVRAFSAGCVRVQDPFALAERLFASDRRWTRKRLEALKGRDMRTLRLPGRVPIHIVYFTAFVDESGELQLRRDLYGHSRRLQQLMQLAS